jgi:hypothetical protein
MLRQRGRVLSSPTPPSLTPHLQAAGAVRSPLWASGFSFSDSSALHEVPYDPALPFLFFGEEVSMAARLFTHGYDFFSPPEAVVYHLWSRGHRPSYLSDAAAAASDRDAVAEQRAASERRVRALLGMEGGDGVPPPPRYGLGARRSLEDFEALVGVRFKQRTVEPLTFPLPAAGLERPVTGIAFADDDVNALLDELTPTPSAIPMKTSSSSNGSSSSSSAAMAALTLAKGLGYF